MFLMRKPKQRPDGAPTCPDCGQALAWQRCEACDGYGAWDAGVGAVTCVFCGGTGWQPAPHACPAHAGDRGPGEALEPGARPVGPETGTGRAAVAEPTARPANMGAARKMALVLLVAFILLVILATTLAPVFLNTR